MISELLYLSIEEMEARIKSDIRQSSEDVAEDYADIVEELEPLLAYAETLKAELVRRIKAKGDAGTLPSNTVDYGRLTVSYRKASTRVSYDSKGLDGYAVANPAVLAFRKETPVRSGAAVRVKK